MVVYPENIVWGYTYVGTVVVVERITVGYQGVQIIVTAGKLYHHQNRVFFGCGHTCCSFESDWLIDRGRDSMV